MLITCILLKYFKCENIISDYGNNGNMNGAEFPNVPVTTLSGLATLTQRK